MTRESFPYYNYLQVMKPFLGEFMGTLMLMYAVMSMALNLANLSKENRLTLAGANNPVIYGIGVSFAVLALIYCFADVSGAHFNPAFTFATVVTRKFPFYKGVLYIIAQCTGSTIATLLAAASYPNLRNSHGEPNAASMLVVGVVSDVNIGEAFLMEVLLTFILMYVVFATAMDDAGPITKQLRVRNKNKDRVVYSVSADVKSGFAPLAISLMVGSLCVVGSSVSMSVFNPARAFGPALVANKWKNQWLYWIADFIGAGFGCFTQKILFAHKSSYF